MNIDPLGCARVYKISDNTEDVIYILARKVQKLLFKNDPDGLDQADT